MAGNPNSGYSILVAAFSVFLVATLFLSSKNVNYWCLKGLCLSQYYVLSLLFFEFLLFTLVSSLCWRLSRNVLRFVTC